MNGHRGHGEACFILCEGGICPSRVEREARALPGAVCQLVRLAVVALSSARI